MRIAANQSPPIADEVGNRVGRAARCRAAREDVGDERRRGQRRMAGDADRLDPWTAAACR
jgi:hypothetical protein